MSAGGQGQWPTYQFDAGNTGHYPAETPVEGPVEIHWRYQGGREGVWPPVVADGTVFAATHGDDLVALDAATGTERWRASLFDEGVGSSPAVAGDTLLVGAWGTGLAGVAMATGEQRWRRTVGGPRFGFGAVVGETAYLSAGYSLLLALDTTDGAERWSYDTARPVDRPDYPDDVTLPAYENGTVYYGNLAGLVALDAETGDEQWRLDGRFLTVTVRDGLVYAVDAAEGRLYALDTAGRVRWQTRTGSNGRVQSVAVDDDAVYFGAQYFSPGVVRAHDRRDGTELWRTELEAYGSLCSPPVVAGETVYIGDGGGYLHALDTADGSDRWRIDLDFEILGPPVVVDDQVFAGTNGGGYVAVGAAES